MFIKKNLDHFEKIVYSVLDPKYGSESLSLLLLLFTKITYLDIAYFDEFVDDLRGDLSHHSGVEKCDVSYLKKVEENYFRPRSYIRIGKV